MLTVPGNGDTNQPKFRFPEIDSKPAQQDGLLGATVKASEPIAPELAARVLKMQVRTGIDRDLIARNLEDVEKEASAADFNPEQFRRTSPKMAKWLSESPYHVAVAREDLKALGNLEAMFFRKDDPTRPLSDKEVEASAQRAAKRMAEKAMEMQPKPTEDPLGKLVQGRAQLELHNMGMSFRSREEAEKTFFAQELGKRQAIEKFIAADGTPGPSEVIAKRFRENPFFFMPFVGSVVDTADALRFYEAAKAVSEGWATDEDEDIVLQAARVNQAAERRGVGILGGAAEILAALPAVAGEFAGTGGVYRGVKVGVERLLHSAMKEAIAGATRGAIRKTAGVLAGGATQTLAMGAQAVPGDTAKRMTPGLGVEANNGELRAILDPSTTDDLGPAIFKSLGSRFVETLSERAGVGMDKLAGPMKKALLARYVAKFPEEGVDGFLKKIREATAWNGIVGEIFEERVAEVGKAAIGAEEYKPPTPEQLISEILAFAVPGGVGAAARGAKRALTPVEAAKQKADEIIPATEVLEAVVQTFKESAVAQKAPEIAERAVETAAANTSSEFAYADARTFNQIVAEKTDAEGKRINPAELVQRLGVTPKEYELAIETGADIKFKTSRAAAELIPNGMEDVFKDHLRFDPGDMSRAEVEAEVKQAVEAAKAEAKAEIAAEADEKKAELSKQYNEGAKRIRETIETGLRSTGRVKANEAKTVGKLVESAFRVMGERYGLNPEEEFSRYKLEIRGPGQAGALGGGRVFNQPTPEEVRADEVFASFVKRVYGGAEKPRTAIPFSKTPKILQALGAQDLVMTIAPEIITKTGIDKHRLDVSVLEDLPKQLRDPLMVFTSATQPNSLVVLTEHLSRDGDPVIAAVHLDRQEEHYQVNRVRSVHSRSMSEIGRWLDRGLARYVDTERMRGRLESAGLQLPGEQADPSKPKLLTKDDIVKSQPAEGGGARGHLHLGDHLKIAIELTEKSDRSTPAHEFFGHFYLNMLGDIVASGRAPEALKADFQAILDYLGAKDAASITGEQHEKWSRTVEKYLMEGRAPSKELRGVLFRFFQWLTEIYKDIKEAYFAGVDLNPKIKGVLDRLLATDAEIQAVQQEESKGFLFADYEAAKKAGATDAEASRHMKRQAELRAAATSRVLARTMADVQRENEEWWEEELTKKKEEVAKEIDQQKVYKVLAAFKEGKLPEGADVGGIGPGDKMRLNTKSVNAVLGADVLVTPVLPRFVLAKHGGVHPDLAAEWFNYPSGAELLDALANAEPRETAIDRIAEERMRAEYGEPPTQAEIAEEAKKAIHGEEYSEIIAEEMKLIAKAGAEGQADTANILFRRLPDRAILRARAREEVASAAYKSIDPRIYEAAERRAYARARKAWNAGNRAEALKAKAEQLANAELYAAAIEAREYVSDKIVEYRKLYRKDEKLAKSRDVDLINAARAILARINLGKVEKSASSYLDAIKKYDPDIYEALLPMVLEAGDNAVEWRDLPYGELRKRFDAVDAMWELSLRTKQFEVEGKKIDLDTVAEELRQALSEMTPASAKRYAHASVTSWEKIKAGLLGIKASLRRMESWVDAMDGGNPKGAFRKYLFTPISEGADQARAMRRRLEKELAGIFKEIEKDFTADKIDAPELGGPFGSFAELFGALLHTGNASNKMKLIVGYGWGSVDENGVLDDSRWEAFRERMIREGRLRKEHYEAAQKIWDLFEREKAAAWRAHRDMYGFYPDEITAEQIVTPFGTFRGGYVPAKADPEKTNDAERREEQEAIMGNDNSFAFPSTGLGATLKRSATYAKPLILDVRLLRQHINWLSRFVHIQPRVRDVGRLMMKRDFRESLDKVDPAVGNDLIAPYLQRAATQVVETPMKGKGGRAIAKVAREVRKRTGTLLMAGNLVNALQNFTGLSLAAVKVKPSYLRASFAKYIRDPKGLAEANRKASVFMDNRMDTEVQAIVGDMEAMLLNASTLDKAKDWVERNQMVLQRTVQNIIDNVVWDAAKDQAVAEGATAEEAIRAANSAVRQTQGSGAPEDISRAETGNAIVRVFNQFWGYFNMQANLLGTEFAKTADEYGLKRGAGKALYIYTMGFMVPAVVAEVIVQMAKGGVGDDDEDGYLDEWLGVFFGSQARTTAALMPGGALMRSGWGAFTTDNRYDDRIQTAPAISVLESAVKAPASIYRAIIDEGKTSTAVKDAMTLLGLLTGLPAPALGRPIGYLSDVAEDVSEPTGPVDVVRGLLTGRPGARR